jgi:hypothetical protein
MVERKIEDINSGLRVFKKSDMLKYAHLCSDRFSFSTTSLLAYLSDSLDVAFLKCRVIKRKGGKSRVSLKDGLRTLLFILQVVMVFNPLKIFISICLWLAAFTLFYVFIDLYTSGQISDTSVLLFVATLILFVFGLLSDQISKLRREISVRNNDR